MRIKILGMLLFLMTVTLHAEMLPWFSPLHFDIISKHFKPGKSYEIKSDVLYKIILGEWESDISEVARFSEDGTYVVINVVENDFKYSGKWRIKENSVELTLDPSDEWCKYSIKSLNYKYSQDSSTIYYSFEIEFNGIPKEYKNRTKIVFNGSLVRAATKKK